MISKLPDIMTVHNTARDMLTNWNGNCVTAQHERYILIQ